MRLESVRLKNFMPYRGVQEVRFPPLGTGNVMIVYGDNGRGKTSLLNAIRWAFTGKALARHLRQIKLTDLLNSEAANAGEFDVEVQVEFEHEGRYFDLRRAARGLPYVALPESDSHFEKIVALRRDGTPLSQTDAEYQLRQILPEEISRFFLFDGELLQEYETLVMQETERSARIKEAIEQVLGVPAISRGEVVIRTLLKSAQKSQANELRNLQAFRAQAEEMLRIQAELEVLHRSLSALKDREATTRDEVSELGQSLGAIEGAEAFAAQIEHLEAEYKEKRDRRTVLEASRLELLQEAWKDLLQPRLKAHVAALERDRERVKDALERRAVTAFQIEQLKKVLDDRECPLCQQAVGHASHRKKMGQELGRLEGELSGTLVDVTHLGDVSGRIIRLLSVQGTGAARQIRTVEDELTIISLRRTEIEIRIQELREKIEGFDPAQAARWRAKREQLMANLGSLEGEVRRTTEQIDTLRRRETQLSRLLSKNPEVRHRRTTKLVEVYSGLDRLFTDGIERLRQSLREEVARHASDAFRQLTTEPTYENLEINLNYGLTIVGDNGLPVRERSSGTEQIVALALISGLNRTARRSGPIIMDTPLGRLDPTHRTNVLSYLPQMAEQVVLLVHEGEIPRASNLGNLNSHIGKVYDIKYVSSRHSQLTETMTGA
jgi:DNA sulfur modification protein DndD